MSCKPIRLVPGLVLAALALLVRPVGAQFNAVGGVVAPRAVPSPVSNFYGGLGAGIGFGAGMGYGGYGTQWMQNPYQGYLQGAADVTMANAQYQLTIQQAKSAREEARRSSLKTRHDAILERQWELSLLPDPEVERQKQMARNAERARRNPPATEIWSGDALNDLLRVIQTAQGTSSSGPDIPLSPEVVKHINISTGKTRGGVGLLREDGKLTWPFVLRQSTFQEPRKELNQLLPQAVKQARTGEVDVDTLNQINAAIKDLERAVDAGASNDLSSSQFIEASRYLRELKESAKVLQQSDVAKYFRSEWTPQGSSVGDLIKQMTSQGLKFGPAVSGDETYYTVLHRAMVDYDRGLSQLTTSGLNP
jgi:hypothetical protein